MEVPLQMAYPLIVDVILQLYHNISLYLQMPGMKVGILITSVCEHWLLRLCA